MITVSVNNQPVQVAAQTTLAGALPQWRRGDAPVAVAVNGEFVAREHYADCELQNGDRVDILRPVSGG